MKDITAILNQYRSFIFISPHLDDAVLSCGFLLDNLRNLKKVVSVITVFTKPSDPPYTRFAQEFMRMCGFSDADRFYKERRREDMKVMKELNCRYVHLDFIDAAWRKKPKCSRLSFSKLITRILPEIAHIYPRKKSVFSGVVNPEDILLEQTIKNTINALILRDSNTLVFAPLGIGGHVDHLIVNRTIRRLSKNLVFWEDYPYNTYLLSDIKTYLLNHKLPLLFRIKRDIAVKLKLIRFYKTQIRALFPSGNINISAERYYIY